MASTLGPQSLQKSAVELAPSTARGVIALAVTDTAARFAIPTAIAGKVCTFVCNGADADILFGASTVAVVYGQASTVNAEAITVHASTGGHLENGVPRRFLVPRPDQCTHFSVDCVGSGSGTLYIEPGL